MSTSVAGRAPSSPRFCSRTHRFVGSSSSVRRCSTGAAYINGDAIVIDGGKMLQSGGGGANTSSMLDWTDEQWAAIRPNKK